ncbi:hypothetical protein GCM10023149_43690 [Mucilaginibacter gynuensis]|uniref:Carboxypeptidase-like protein n=1 Tax=Mucilaginibacter gynuensis TaxID=1302236 RepID=A0ABP8H8L0_9SPHI
MRTIFLIFLYLLPLGCLAQYSITGKIVNATDNTAFPDASVLLSNTTVGTKSNDDGSFTLNNVMPGKYTLIVSAVGFEKYQQEIMVNKNIAVNNITLKVKTTVLQDVTIKLDPNRNKYLAMFTKQFLGSKGNALQCKILNPEVLRFDFDQAANVLYAYADDFIELENKALGYKIKYLLKYFSTNESYGQTSYTGEHVFEKLTGDAKAEKEWEENRKEAYNGSPKHFFRSLIANNLKKEKFYVFKVTREGWSLLPNKLLIKKLIDKDTLRLKNITDADISSTSFGKPGNERLKLVQPKLERADIFSKTDQPGLYALRFDDLLTHLMFVMYTKKTVLKNTYYFVNTSFTIDKSATFIIFSKPYALFDDNGIVASSGSIVFSGEWSDSRIGELLPADYWPDK